MIPGIQQQPPLGFHAEDVQVQIYWSEEDREFTHPLFAWKATFPKLRKTFFVYRPDVPPSTCRERHTGYRIDRSNQARTTKPHWSGFYYALLKALGTCRGSAAH